ncbi:hypothetical protein LshimejAT787_1900350 [Lyophyllum shimeji]|uniref:Uncharacterized protein n=1 Tax=Lyophyllum shimeji TaxID=47721 RepID=A0A9P3Q182_LYOSH|nr:hypothetical protein LshimejAT787_1900350 [Lyophyllum shimeji]
MHIRCNIATRDSGAARCAPKLQTRSYAFGNKSPLGLARYQFRRLLQQLLIPRTAQRSRSAAPIGFQLWFLLFIWGRKPLSG